MCLFLGREQALSQDPSQVGRGTPSPYPIAHPMSLLDPPLCPLEFQPDLRHWLRRRRRTDQSVSRPPGRHPADGNITTTCRLRGRHVWAGRGGQLMANIIDVARQTRDVTMTRSMTSLFHVAPLPSSRQTSPTQRLRRSLTPLSLHLLLLLLLPITQLNRSGAT